MFKTYLTLVTFAGCCIVASEKQLQVEETTQPQNKLISMIRSVTETEGFKKVIVPAVAWAVASYATRLLTNTNCFDSSFNPCCALKDTNDTWNVYLISKDFTTPKYSGLSTNQFNRQFYKFPSYLAPNTYLSALNNSVGTVASFPYLSYLRKFRPETISDKTALKTRTAIANFTGNYIFYTCLSRSAYYLTRYFNSNVDLCAYGAMILTFAIRDK